MKIVNRPLILFSLIGNVLVSFSQEYDDLYFTKKDRVKLEELREEPEPVVQSSPGRQIEQSYSNHEVTPEAIAKYKRSNIAVSDQEGDIESPNYSIPEEASEDQQAIVNNYYGDPRYYPNRFSSGWGFGSRWNTWRGIGTGFGYGNFYDPWYDPFYYSISTDPWLGYGWNSYYGSFYNPYYRGSFWRNSYTRDFYPGYCNTAYRYYPTHGTATTETGEPKGRKVQRGARYSRGGSVSYSGRSGRSKTPTTNQVANQKNESGDSRNFSDTQTQYLKKSRQSTQTRIYNSNTGTSTIRARNSSRIYNSGTPTINSGRRQRSTINDSRQQRQRSYSTPNRSRSTPSYNRVSPSRSRSTGGGSKTSGNSTRRKHN